MNKDNKPRLLLSDTPVPDAFIMQYVQELSKDAVGIYLWLLMRGLKDGFELTDVREYSILPEKDCDDAVAELISKGLLSKKTENKQDKFYLVDLKQKEVDAYVKTCMARGVDSNGLALSADEEIRNQLAESISKTCYMGKMPYLYYRLIDKCLYEYHFEDLVIYKLFEEGKEKKFQFSSEKMNNLASEWYAKGYTTSDKLSVYIEKNQQFKAVVDKMSSLVRRRLNGVDMERISKWVHDFGVTESLAEYAFRCNEYRQNITLKHVEDTLLAWVTAGITSIDQAMVYENDKHNENKRKSARKGGRSNSWKTGAEAGLMSSDKPDSEKPDSKESDSNSRGKDVLLDLFGDDDDEDN